MAIKLAPRQQKTVLVIAGLGVVTAGIYLGLIMLPMWNQYTNFSSQITQARQQLGILQAVTVREPQLHQQHRDLLQSVRSWRERLPRAGETSSVIEHISEFAAQAGVKVLSIVPLTDASAPVAASKPASAKPPYYTVPIQMEAMAGYHQLGRFVDLIEGTSTPMQIVSLRVAGNLKDSARHRVRLMIQAYVASESLGDEAASKEETS